MKFLNSDREDFEVIFRLYDAAIEFQKTVFDKSWLPFDREMISKEIAEKRHWKILIDGKIACIFSVTFSDVFIWKEKNTDAAIYIHRIVTNPEFRGRKFVPVITDWAIDYAINRQKIRADGHLGR